MAVGELPPEVLRALEPSPQPSAEIASLQARARRARALSALMRMQEVDVSITQARRATAQLEEARALRELARAEQQLLASLALPGGATFYAELQLQIGVSAAHAGLFELASAAFGRAATVDPGRRLLAGEAAPEVVALASRAFARVSAAPEGTLHVDTAAVAARVFVDDVELGVAPLWSRVRSGTHVLRLEADGYTPYAMLFDVLPGDRPPVFVQLAPEPSLTAISALREAMVHDSARGVLEACKRLLALEPELAKVLLGERRDERGWVARCDREGCTLFTYSGAATQLQISEGRPLTSTLLASAHAWLTPGQSVAQATRVAVEAPLWQRWYVWAAAGALVVGAGVWVGAATQPDPVRSLRVSVDPSALR